MGNEFYRKKPTRFRSRAVLRKILKSRRFLVALLIALPVTGFVIFGNHGLLQRLRLQAEKQLLEEKIRVAEEEKRKMEAESKALDGDRNAIERVARERHGMQREGETVYKVRKRQE